MKSRVFVVALIACAAFFTACMEETLSAENNADASVPVSTMTGGLGMESPSSGVDAVASSSSVIPVVPHEPGFNPCQFNFGAAWQAAHEEEIYYKGLDYVAVWLGDNDYYNDFEKRMVETCVNIHATPMIYAYVIAEFGHDQGLVDCNMTDEDHPNSLCNYGANIIRQYFADSILYRYEQYASGMREQLEIFLDQNPDTFETIWLIEPDLYQYSATGSAQKYEFDKTSQIGGGIPDADLGVYFNQIVSVIKKYLPAAKIAIDISPWISDWDSTSQTAWYSNFDLSQVDYASTSGGGTAAGSDKIRAGNKATWKEIYEVTGKPILADAGYDKGGAGTGHATIWDNARNLNARIADYVIGVMQMDAALDYPARLDTIRAQLTLSYPWCAGL